MVSAFRAALPGDIFLLLQPTRTEEEQRLQQYQQLLQQRYGGHCSADFHVTYQRLLLRDASQLSPMLHHLTSCLGNLTHFYLRPGALTQFYSSFWKQVMLRWQIAHTAEWQQFDELIRFVLVQEGCQPDYPPEKPVTCTALLLDALLNEQDLDATAFPDQLFTVEQVRITRLREGFTFEHLQTIYLDHSD